MVKRLRSVLRNPVSPLVLKAGSLSLFIFWMRLGQFSLLRSLTLLIVFLFLYLKPPINAGRHWVSALALIIIALQTPLVGGLLGFYVNLTLGILGFLLLGVKNLIFIRKQAAYYTLHLVLLVGVASLFFLQIISPVTTFALLFLLFREFYSFVPPKHPELLNLIAASLGMLLMQVAWVASFFPTSFLVNASFLVMVAFLAHDAILNYFRGTFTEKLAWRNLVVFAVLTIVILILPVWGFK